MQDLVAKIAKVITDNVSMSYTRADVDCIKISQNSSIKIRIPKNHKDNSLMLQITTDLTEENGILTFHIQNTFEFSLSGTPKDYIEFGKTVCIPIAQEEQNNIINSVVKNFGITTQASENE